MFVIDWAYNYLVKLTKGNSVGKPFFHIKDRMTIHSSKIEVPDQIGNENCVKCTFGVKKQQEYWLLGDKLGVLNCFSDEKRDQLMTGPFTLILGLSLNFVSLFNLQISDINVKAFCKERTGTDCPIGAI